MDVSQIIEALGEGEGLPVDAIRAAQANRETMVPAFLRTIDDFLELREPVDPNALFFMFHLLGEWREKSAYWPLSVFLRLPAGVVGEILGSAVTETSHRVMAAVFDGDPEPLYDIIRDEEADEFIRSRMCQAVAMLTRSGDLSRETTKEFLRDCFAQLEPQQDCYVWQGWLDAIAWLGLAELKPLAEQAFSRGSIDPTWLSFKDFEKDLQHALVHPEAEPLHPDGSHALFGDTVVELSKWAGFKPKGSDTPNWGPPDSLGTPHRNPVRKVGRNDPCPCGSGKKFKKCCLNADSDDFSAADPFAEAVGPILLRR